MLSEGRTGAISTRQQMMTAEAVLIMTRMMLLLLIKRSRCTAEVLRAAETIHSLAGPLQRDEEEQESTAAILPKRRLR